MYRCTLLFTGASVHFLSLSSQRLPNPPICDETLSSPKIRCASRLQLCLGQQRLGFPTRRLRSATCCAINSMEHDALFHCKEGIVHARPANKGVPVEHQPLRRAPESLRKSESDRPQHCQSRESDDLQHKCRSAQCGLVLTCSSRASLKPLGDTGRNRNQGFYAGVIDAHDDHEREI